jgi:hypothetical protein
MADSERAEPEPRAVESRGLAVPVRRRSPRRSRWVGVLICRKCDAELSEVLADESDDTYLPTLGGHRIRNMDVPCLACGTVRHFETTRTRPLVVDAIANRNYSKT